MNRKKTIGCLLTTALLLGLASPTEAVSDPPSSIPPCPFDEPLGEMEAFELMAIYVDVGDYLQFDATEAGFPYPDVRAGLDLEDGWWESIDIDLLCQVWDEGKPVPNTEFAQVQPMGSIYSTCNGSLSKETKIERSTTAGGFLIIWFVHDKVKVEETIHYGYTCESSIQVGAAGWGGVQRVVHATYANGAVTTSPCSYDGVLQTHCTTPMASAGGDAAGGSGTVESGGPGYPTTMKACIQHTVTGQSHQAPVSTGPLSSTVTKDLSNVCDETAIDYPDLEMLVGLLP